MLMGLTTPHIIPNLHINVGWMKRNAEICSKIQDSVKIVVWDSIQMSVLC